MTSNEFTAGTSATPEGIVIVEATDYINNEAGQRLAETARAAFGDGPPRVLLDLERTRIVNSIGVSILLELLEEILDRGGTMAFCNVSPAISKTFDIMGLARYAALYPDRTSALAAMTGDGR